MRFTADGPNIPNELLIAQDEGRVVFFCGSGVSRESAGLPDFYGLLERVFVRLKADAACEAKRRFDAKEGISADRLFTLLRREFRAAEINQAVAQSLCPPAEASLAAHRTMLRLARHNSGGLRLITTNFDRLFEQCDPTLKAKSSTRARLPRLEFVEDDWGLVHLHGRVLEDYCDADTDGFVLCSAEFGDAYLAHGWARDFVKRVLERHVAVFVGYSADDPPMQYLLEGLQQSNSGERRLYAFQQGSEDQANAQWYEKGVTAIAFDASNGYSPLWNTLDAWARRSSDPIAWRKRVFALARKGPQVLQPHERGMLAHVVSTRRGALELRDAAPRIPTSWLGVFDHRIRFDRPYKSYSQDRPDAVIDPYTYYHLDDDPLPHNPEESQERNRAIPENVWDAFSLHSADRRTSNDTELASIRGYTATNPAYLTGRLSALGEWIAQMAHAPATVWWAARQDGLHPHILHAVRRRIYRTDLEPISPAVKRAWHYLLQVFENKHTDKFDVYEFERELREGGWTPSAIRRYGDIFRPRYELNSLYRPPIAPRGKAKLGELIHVGVAYPEQMVPIEVPDSALLGVIEQLRNNLEIAIGLESERCGWLDLCAIEPDDDADGTEFSRSYKLSGYALHFIGLFKRLIQIDNNAARNEFLKWRRSDRVFVRMRFWASGIIDLTSPDEFADEIDSLSPPDFWDAHNERDLLIVLARRWQQLPIVRRKRIEKRILSGPPYSRRIGKDENTKRSAHAQMNRIYWLRLQGCTLSLDIDRKLASLREQFPEWREEWGARAAESLDGRSGTVQIEKDWSALANLPVGEVLGAAKQGTGRKRFREFVEYAPFSGLCEERPVLALRALSFELKKGRFDEDFWQAFLSNEKRSNDNARLKRVIAGRLAELESAQLCQILLTAARWFQHEGSELKTSHYNVYRRLWQRMVESLRVFGDSARSALIRKNHYADWVTEAINAPAGCLAELFIDDPQKDEFTRDAGFSPEALARADELLALPAPSRQYALTIFGLNLAWLNYLHPTWVTAALLPSLVHPELNCDDSRAAWAGLLFSRRVPAPQLFMLLKGRLLVLAQNPSADRREITESLAGFVLSGWGSRNEAGERYVSDAELRLTLLQSDDEFRCKVLWLLRQWSGESEGHWANSVLILLQEVWPRNKKARTPKVSADLCELAFAQKQNFAAMASAVAKLVGKIDESDRLMLDDHNEVAKQEKRKFPNETIELLYAILPESARRWPYGTVQLLSDLASLELRHESRNKLNELQFRLRDF